MSSSPSSESKQQIIGPKGQLIPNRITWRQRWESLSKKTWIGIMSLAALLAALATLAANAQAIRDLFRPESSPPTVPPIVVEIANSSKKPIDVATRGDFPLWYPGPDAAHSSGRYEFHNLDGSSPDSGKIAVAPSAKVRVLAYVMNQDLYGRILQRGDCDVAVVVRNAAGGIGITDNLPFTREAIDKYFTAVDIGDD